MPKIKYVTLIISFMKDSLKTIQDRPTFRALSNQFFVTRLCSKTLPKICQKRNLATKNNFLAYGENT